MPQSQKEKYKKVDQIFVVDYIVMGIKYFVLPHRS